MRVAAPKVVLVEITSTGWEHAIVQADSIDEFVEQLESETFAFRFEG